MSIQPLRKLAGIAAPLMQDNVDTDAIIPSRETQSIARSGYGEKLFANWRYQPGTRIENPDFILNQDPYRQAEILLAGVNFGCGSSREAAAWSLFQFGIRCVIAASYGAIFRNNCIRNGVAPVLLPTETIEAIAGWVRERPELHLIVDLERMVVACPDRGEFPFALNPRERDMLLNGLDEVGVTLQYEREIDSFRARQRAQHPWVYPAPAPA